MKTTNRVLLAVTVIYTLLLGISLDSLVEDKLLLLYSLSGLGMLILSCKITQPKTKQDD